jgi:hypothetical protein
VTVPAETNPEVAALTFSRDLQRFWDSGEPVARGWQRSRIDPLTEVLTLVGDDGGVRLPYYVRLRANWYPDYPLQVTFVEPDGVTEPPQASTWLPAIQALPFGFQIHWIYDYRNPQTQEIVERRQLVCFSQSFDYYVSGHVPGAGEAWGYPRQTLAATLNRLHEVLQPPIYAGAQSPRPPIAYAA